MLDNWLDTGPRCPASFVTVTHPFHPLAGQRLRVLFERQLAGGLAVSCEGGPLGSLMVPLAWTDRGPPAAADVPLTYEVLIDLARVTRPSILRHAGVRSLTPAVSTWQFLV